MTDRPVLAVAHRMGNSLDEFRQAVTAGADLVEADVHAYRGRLEVRHLKTLGPLPWMWDRWYLVPARTPRLLLPDLLAEIEPQAELMLDLKGVQRHLAPAVADLLRGMDPAYPVTVCSRHWWMLDTFTGLDHVKVVHSARSRFELRRLLRRLARTPTYGVSVHRSLLDERVVRVLHTYAEVVMTWPVDTVDELDEVLALGVTGVTSDDLRVVETLAGRRRTG